MIVSNNTVDLEVARRGCAVATATRDKLALLGGCADATATARKGGTAALGLALVVLEDEQRVRTGLKLGAHELLIRSRVAPRRHSILRHYILGIKVTNGFIAFAITTRILQEIIGKSLARRS
jgi:hypothetical protein